MGYPVETMLIKTLGELLVVCQQVVEGVGPSAVTLSGRSSAACSMRIGLHVRVVSARRGRSDRRDGLTAGGS